MRNPFLTLEKLLLNSYPHLVHYTREISKTHSSFNFLNYTPNLPTKLVLKIIFKKNTWWMKTFKLTHMLGILVDFRFIFSHTQRLV